MSRLIEEGNGDGLFDSKYPQEAAEMIMLYSTVAFDELAELTPEEKNRKGKAFICYTERILGCPENSLESAITAILSKQ